MYACIGPASSGRALARSAERTAPIRSASAATPGTVDPRAAPRKPAATRTRTVPYFRVLTVVAQGQARPDGVGEAAGVVKALPAERERAAGAPGEHHGAGGLAQRAEGD